AHVHARREAVRGLPAEAGRVDAETEAVASEGRVRELVRVVDPERPRVEEGSERRRAGRLVDGDGGGAAGEVGAHLRARGRGQREGEGEDGGSGDGAHGRGGLGDGRIAVMAPAVNTL